jgi:hypothetical protein
VSFVNGHADVSAADPVTGSVFTETAQAAHWVRRRNGYISSAGA